MSDEELLRRQVDLLSQQNAVLGQIAKDGEFGQPGAIVEAHRSLGFARAAGLDEWVAIDEEDLVANASALAHDSASPARLATLRAGMRFRLAASAACDTAGLCRELEQVYQQSVI